MGELKLTAELVEVLYRQVAQHDTQATDPGIAAQYLAAAIGVMLGNAELEAARKQAIFVQLCEFARGVFEDVDAQRRVGEQTPQAAFGIWRPGE